jgi:hypothetical protein
MVDTDLVKATLNSELQEKIEEELTSPIPEPTVQEAIDAATGPGFTNGEGIEDVKFPQSSLDYKPSTEDVSLNSDRADLYREAWDNTSAIEGETNYDEDEDDEDEYYSNNINSHKSSPLNGPISISNCNFSGVGQNSELSKAVVALAKALEANANAVSEVAKIMGKMDSSPLFKIGG